MYKVGKAEKRRLQAQYNRRPSRSLLIENQRAFVKLTWFILLSVALIWVWQKCHDPRIWPISHVKILGDLVHVPKTVLRQAIMPFLQDSWLGLDSEDLKERLLQLAWMASVTVRRVWPNVLEIRFTVRQAVAQLTDHTWLDSQGGIFNPGPVIIETHLPLFIGPANQYRSMLKHYQIMQSLLRTLALSIKTFKSSPPRAWQVQLSNGLWLSLGQHKPVERLQRFIKVYREVVATKVNVIDYVDLRYAHGMAIRFKAPLLNAVSTPE